MSNQPDQEFAVKQLAALHDAWVKSPTPNEPIWRKRWAELAIRAGLPCADEHATPGSDLGPDGWRQWATV